LPAKQAGKSKQNKKDQTPELLLRPRCATSVIMNKTKNKKNKIFATPAAAIAIPVKPRTAAIIAITKNINAQYNIEVLLGVRLFWEFESSAPLFRHAIN
jgi:hypothetical protein